MSLNLEKLKKDDWFWYVDEWFRVNKSQCLDDDFKENAYSKVKIGHVRIILNGSNLLERGFYSEIEAVEFALEKLKEKETELSDLLEKLKGK